MCIRFESGNDATIHSYGGTYSRSVYSFIHHCLVLLNNNTCIYYVLYYMLCICFKLLQFFQLLWSPQDTQRLVSLLCSRSYYETRKTLKHQTHTFKTVPAVTVNAFDLLYAVVYIAGVNFVQFYYENVHSWIYIIHISYNRRILSCSWKYQSYTKSSSQHNQCS